jgi:hypothetical protein
MARAGPQRHKKIASKGICKNTVLKQLVSLHHFNYICLFHMISFTTKLQKRYKNNLSIQA